MQVLFNLTCTNSDPAQRCVRLESHGPHMYEACTFKEVAAGTSFAALAFRRTEKWRRLLSLQVPVQHLEFGYRPCCCLFVWQIF